MPTYKRVNMNGVELRAVENADGSLTLASTLDGESIVLSVSDLQLGAMEGKDGDTDNRWNIKAANTARTAGTLVLAVQPIGADGTVQTGQPVLTVPSGFIKTVALTTTPEALAADGTFFQHALIGGIKAVGTNNVGDVRLGVTSADGTQPFPIHPGEWYTLDAPAGQKFDLNDWFLDVDNAGDGLAVIRS